MLPFTWLAPVLLGFAAAQVGVEKLEDRIRVTLGGEAFCELHLSDADKPYLFPLLGPGQVAMTRGFPMKTVEGEEQDHPHHRSLWFAHGDVDGHDFWADADGKARIVHVEVVEAKGGECGVVKTKSRWEWDGTPLLDDVRTLEFAGDEKQRTIDFRVELTPSGDAVRFGDTKEGTFAIRLNEELRLAGPRATGAIRDSEGRKDGECWGKRASWVDYAGKVGGKPVGVAIFDHPSNLRHPTWWHVRDYGLFAANPFGVHDFEVKPKGEGDYVLEKGATLALRYRVVLHAGERTKEELEAEAARFAASK